MKQFYAFVLLASLFLWQQTTQVWASNDKNSLGAKAGSMGGASITNADAFSIFANQAALARVKSFNIGIYAENRFLLTDLSLYAVGLAMPTKAGSFGLGIQYFGNTDYNEKQFRLGYGRTLFEKLDLGIELTAISVGMNEYGNVMAFTFGIGMLYSFNEHLQVGAHVYNPLRISLTDQEQDRLPTLMKIGLNYTPSEKTSILVEAEKNLNAAFMLKVGIEYRPIEKLYIRAGISNSPAQYAFGVGLNLGKLKIDAGASLHEALGYTPMVSLMFGQ